MNNVEKILGRWDVLEQAAKDYFKYLYDLLCEVDPGELSAFAKQLQQARGACHTVFFIGNGVHKKLWVNSLSKLNISSQK